MFVSSLSLPFYSSSKPRRTNYKLSAVSFLSFLHSFPFLYNVLKFDMGQSITRKCKNPTPYVEQEGQRASIISLVTSKQISKKYSPVQTALY